VIRQEIIQQLKQNLGERFTVPIYRGFPGMSVHQLPSLWLVEHGEESKLDTSGTYKRSLEISIEYFDGMRSSIEETFDFLIEILDAVREAVEVVRYYRFPITEMYELENLYSALPDSRFNLSVAYKFVYVEPFKGSWRPRNNI